MTQAPHPIRRTTRTHALVALAVAAAAYAGALFHLQRQPGFALAEPLFLLAVLGVAFPLLAWGLTRRARAAPPVAPGHDRARLPAVLLYLAVFAALVLGWGFSAIQQAFPDEPAQSIVQVLVKLATMVVLPLVLFTEWRRRRVGPLGRGRLLLVFVVMSLAYLGLQAVFGRGLATLSALAPAASTLAWAIPACFAWQTIEAGLAEEVLFRRVLQEQFAIATGSHLAAIAWASLLFGLAHAPGLWMRGAHAMEGVAQASPGWAVAYSIVMIAPAGIAFGVLWARTRSLMLLVPLHGMVDLVPQLAPFIRAWTGG
ncbi:MAG TPA: type II CAAX endopeptidase family protein [Xanthomonadales bacterium]|nr:type II CAAX endopeptidase family protein [Xanthomonadales bacterium]